MSDPFSLLGISRGASPGSCKKAFNKLALKYHPDKVTNKDEATVKEATKKFQDIKTAYEQCLAYKSESSSANIHAGSTSTNYSNHDYTGAASSSTHAHAPTSSSYTNPRYNPNHLNPNHKDYRPNHPGPTVVPNPNIVPNPNASDHTHDDVTSSDGIPGVRFQGTKNPEFN